MDLQDTIKELQQERANLDEAIAALERLARGQVRPRGRPPAWLREPPESAAVRGPGRPRKTGARKKRGPRKKTNAGEPAPAD